MQPHNWRLDLTWDGTAYVGWQRQPNGISIQQVVEEKLAIIFAEQDITVMAAGRTDSGVHALQQVASFSTGNYRTPKVILRGLNGLLPNDIACLQVQEAPQHFHARHWALEKQYRYRILASRIPSPHRYKYCWRRGEKLDHSAMIRAASYFQGEHDFKSFQAAGCGARHSVRLLHSAELKVHEDELWFEVKGNGFLRHQIRIMVGTLMEVGRGKIAAADIPKIISAKDRNVAGPTAPAHGLWLVGSKVAASLSEIDERRRLSFEKTIVSLDTDIDTI